MYKCKVCSQLFYSTVDVEAHLEKGHTDSNPGSYVLVKYQCPICEEQFGHWYDCKNHTLREHGRYSVTCQEREVGELREKV